MPEKPLNMLDILKQLDKSNCGKCGLATCTAFAALAARGQKNLKDCPLLSEEQVRRLGGAVVRKPENEDAANAERLEKLKQAVQETDFQQAAERTGGTVEDGSLSIPILGKRFQLDRQGNLTSECHVNAWVYLPLVNYVLDCAGRPLTHRWVPFRDLKQAKDWERFFNHRCEQGIKQIVDQDPDFFFDAMSMFSPSPAETASGEAFSTADDVVIVYPMPRLPLMMAYWRVDGEFKSKLTLFFDTSAEVNLGAQSIYMLTQGILEMFRRIFSTHGLENG
jgi:hypothetical protein